MIHSIKIRITVVKNGYSKKYEVELLSTTDIAKLENVGSTVISQWLKRHGIKARSIGDGWKQARKNGKLKNLGSYRGENHHWYGRKLTKEHREKISNASKGEKNIHWNNGVLTTVQGYRKIRVKETYIQEHRVNMEKSIGRELKKTEVVHHINEDKEDNKIENLFLFKSNKDHAYYHKMKNNGKEVELKYTYDELYNTQIVCHTCGKKFNVAPSIKDIRKYCCRKCYLDSFHM
jgi:hypothetical protein